MWSRRHLPDTDLGVVSYFRRGFLNRLSAPFIRAYCLLYGRAQWRNSPPRWIVLTIPIHSSHGCWIGAYWETTAGQNSLKVSDCHSQKSTNQTHGTRHKNRAHQDDIQNWPPSYWETTDQSQNSDPLGASYGHHGRAAGHTDHYKPEWLHLYSIHFICAPEYQSYSLPFYSLQIERTLLIARRRWGVKIRVSR